MNILKTLIGGVADKALGVVDELVEDKDQAARLKQALRLRIAESADAALHEKSAIIQAEASGESWLQRNWRPILMLVIVSIVANNYLVSPYIGAMFGIGLQLDLPPRLWDLMTVGVGGYIGIQGGERMVTAWQNGKVNQKQAERAKRGP